MHSMERVGAFHQALKFLCVFLGDILILLFIFNLSVYFKYLLCWKVLVGYSVKTCYMFKHVNWVMIIMMFVQAVLFYGGGVEKC